MNPGISSEEGIAVFLVLCSKVIDSLALCYKSGTFQLFMYNPLFLPDP
jgi:hypothetical protein